MTHRICTSEAEGVTAHFQRLWRTLLTPTIEPRSRLEHLFELETPEFGLSYAFASSIDVENETEHFEIVHGSHEVLKTDNTIPLSSSYCRETIRDPEGTMAISDAVAEGWGDDPAYETFEFGSYLGTTVSVDDELYGTLCFADTAARTEPFRNEEKTLLEMYSQWVEYVLTRRDEPPVQETYINTIEGRPVSSDAIDSMMDALKDRTRRVVLMTLVGDTTKTSIGTLERWMNQEREQIRLYHSHLPRLAKAGYITWDTDADTISKGPKFFEVEPLVRLLKEYEERFPE